MKVIHRLDVSQQAALKSCQTGCGTVGALSFSYMIVHFYDKLK